MLSQSLGAIRLPRLGSDRLCTELLRQVMSPHTIPICDDRSSCFLAVWYPGSRDRVLKFTVDGPHLLIKIRERGKMAVVLRPPGYPGPDPCPTRPSLLFPISTSHSNCWISSIVSGRSPDFAWSSLAVASVHSLKAAKSPCEGWVRRYAGSESDFGSHSYLPQLFSHRVHGQTRRGPCPWGST